MLSDNLRKLKEITPKLSKFIISKPNHDSSNPGNFIEYSPNDGGTFLGFGLFKNTNIAVQRVFMSKGTKIPEHNHKEWECCITYSGNYILHYKEEDREMPPKSIAIFEPDKPHSGIMLEDTWIIAITIPASGDYPNA